MNSFFPSKFDLAMRCSALEISVHTSTSPQNILKQTWQHKISPPPTHTHTSSLSFPLWNMLLQHAHISVFHTVIIIIIITLSLCLSCACMHMCTQTHTQTHTHTHLKTDSMLTGKKPAWLWLSVQLSLSCTAFMGYMEKLWWHPVWPSLV